MFAIIVSKRRIFKKRKDARKYYFSQSILTLDNKNFKNLLILTDGKYEDEIEKYNTLIEAKTAVKELENYSRNKYVFNIVEYSEGAYKIQLGDDQRHGKTKTD